MLAYAVRRVLVSGPILFIGDDLSRSARAMRGEGG
ncbi:MAG: hypothetical protein QOH09_942 [Pseudonocardiales bacterium]|jgi:hypothetical protein|nr:hypothetical protein [Pseudonocardiales bacterium]MDT7714950.1 hypothetical protein [Pseudonocardiales bacterium]